MSSVVQVVTPEAGTPRAEKVGALVMLVLLCSNPFMGLVFTAVGPVLPSLMKAFEGSGRDPALMAQMVMTVPGIGVILAGPVVGWLTQRFGAASITRWSLVGFAVAGAAGLAVEKFVPFLVSRFLLGVSASAIATSTLALIGEHFRDETRARVLSYQAAAGAAFGFVSLLASGAVAQAFGWRASFGLYGLALLVWLCAQVPLNGGSAGREEPTSAAAPTGSLWTLWPAYALIVVVFIAVFMNAVQASFLLAADGFSSPAVQSMVLASGAIANSAGAMSYGWIRPRLGSRWTFAGCLGLMAAGFIILGLGGPLPGKLVGLVAASLGAGCVGPYVANLLLDRAAPALRARAAGVMYSMIYVGDFLNPVVMAPLRRMFGIHGAFVTLGALCFVGTAIVLLRRRSAAR